MGAVRISYVTAAPTVLPNVYNYKFLMQKNLAQTKSRLFEFEKLWV